MLVLGGAATLLAIDTNWSTGIIRILPPGPARRRGHRGDDPPDHRTVRARLHRRHGRNRALRRDRCRRIGRNAADPLRVRSDARRAHRYATARGLSLSPASRNRGMAQPFTRLPSVPDLPALEHEILE